MFKIAITSMVLLLAIVKCGMSSTISSEEADDAYERWLKNKHDLNRDWFGSGEGRKSAEMSAKVLNLTHNLNTSLIERLVSGFNQNQDRKLVHVELSDAEKQAHLNRLYGEFRSTLPYDSSFLNLPDKQVAYNQLIVHAQDTNDHRNVKLGKHYGRKDCNANLTIMRSPRFRVCPWYHQTIERKNRFPHVRIIAKCSCSTCLSVLIINGNEVPYGCLQEHVLMPVLVRKNRHHKVVSAETAEHYWEFGLEQVPVSCSCGSNRDPQN